MAKTSKPKTVAKAALPVRRPKALPHAAENEMQRHPSFSFHYAETGGEGLCAFSPAPDDAAELLKFVCDMSRSTWGEIRSMQTGGRDRHRKHHEQPPTSIVDEAQARLLARELDAVMPDDLFRFRLSGEKRLWGFILDGMFYALWWDAGHGIYPTEKAHT
jgi:hypothetical protein